MSSSSQATNNSLEQTVSTPETQDKLDPKYDFSPKIRQRSIWPSVKAYVIWQAALRQAPDETALYSEIPDVAPLSVNIDPTSACNYACPYCVDIDILNTGKQYNFEMLKNSIDLRHSRGLKSAIIIGGGEPTLYPHFEELVQYMKAKDMQIGIVNNGTGMAKMANISPFLDKEDWVRLSLDAGKDNTFQGMHLPKGKMLQATSRNIDGSIPLPMLAQQTRKLPKIDITLEDICKGAQEVRNANPDLTLGYTYIISWENATSNNSDIVTNLDEMADAAYLARDHGFSYLSLKPLLDRDPETHSEMLAMDKSDPNYGTLVETIRKEIDAIKPLETDTFKILVTNNLRAMLNGTEDHYKDQPRNCHTNFFRQVFGIRGMALCPTYRSDPTARIGTMEAYATEENSQATRINLAERIRNLDVSQKCRKMVCMYRDLNWFIEDMIEKEISHSGYVESIQPIDDFGDYSF